MEILSGWIAAGSWSDDWRLPRGLIDGAEVFVVFPPPPPPIIEPDYNCLDWLIVLGGGNRRDRPPGSPRIDQDRPGSILTTVPSEDPS